MTLIETIEGMFSGEMFEKISAEYNKLKKTYRNIAFSSLRQAMDGTAILLTEAQTAMAVAGILMTEDEQHEFRSKITNFVEVALADEMPERTIKNFLEDDADISEIRDLFGLLNAVEAYTLAKQETSAESAPEPEKKPKPRKKSEHEDYTPIAKAMERFHCTDLNSFKNFADYRGLEIRVIDGKQVITTEAIEKFERTHKYHPSAGRWYTKRRKKAQIPLSKSAELDLIKTYGKYMSTKQASAVMHFKSSHALNESVRRGNFSFTTDERGNRAVLTEQVVDYISSRVYNKKTGRWNKHEQLEKKEKQAAPKTPEKELSEIYGKWLLLEDIVNIAGAYSIKSMRVRTSDKRYTALIIKKEDTDNRKRRLHKINKDNAFVYFRGVPNPSKQELEKLVKKYNIKTKATKKPELPEQPQETYIGKRMRISRIAALPNAFGYSTICAKVKESGVKRNSDGTITITKKNQYMFFREKSKTKQLPQEEQDVGDYIDSQTIKPGESEPETGIESFLNNEEGTGLSFAEENKYCVSYNALVSSIVPEKSRRSLGSYKAAAKVIIPELEKAGLIKKLGIKYFFDPGNLNQIVKIMAQKLSWADKSARIELKLNLDDARIYLDRRHGCGFSKTILDEHYSNLAEMRHGEKTFSTVKLDMAVRENMFKVVPIDEIGIEGITRTFVQSKRLLATALYREVEGVPAKCVEIIRKRYLTNLASEN